MGATARCGRIAVCGWPPELPSGPRSQTEANRVASGVVEVTDRSIRALPTTVSGAVNGSVPKVAV